LRKFVLSGAKKSASLPKKQHMKKQLLLVLLFTVATKALFAQDCKNYYYLLNNAEVEMSIYDSKSAVVAKSLYNVLSVKRDGNGATSDFTATIKDPKGNVIASGKNQFKCTGDNIALDMKMTLPNLPQLQNMKVSADSAAAFLSYPATLKEGQSLPDGSFEMSGNANGMDMNLEYKVTDRKVVGKEKITTPAGTWDCFKITYNMNLSMKMMGMNIPMNLAAAEWFAPGFGVVKTESYKDGSRIGSMMITRLKK
jgi:hypothetical protein